MKTITTIQATTKKGKSYTEVDRLFEENMIVFRVVESHLADDDSWTENEVIIIREDLPSIETELGVGDNTYNLTIGPNHDYYDIDEGERLAEISAIEYIKNNF